MTTIVRLFQCAIPGRPRSEPADWISTMERAIDVRQRTGHRVLLFRAGEPFQFYELPPFLDIPDHV